MIYSSPEFFALLALTVIAYSTARSQRGRFGVLLFASTVFYAWAGWFDFLIFELVMLAAWLTVTFSAIYPGRKKQLITLGISLILVHLVTWRYLPWILHLRWAVPLGIGFYTLQKIGYLADVYRRKSKPISLRQYLLFNGFFPQLIAGPITRASDLLPQLERLGPIRNSNVFAGVALFALGFFKKVVIADHLAIFVDHVFDQPIGHGRAELLMAILAFACQLWADISGYTDMGRGAARIFGIELPENFLSPFLARGPAEFWRRWHITVSEWFRDYLFIPLWMRHQSVLGGGLVLLLTMVLAGLWHGADWLLVFYGLYWGSLLWAEHRWTQTSLFRDGFGGLPSWFRWLSSLSLMFVLMLFSRLLFRAGNFGRLAEFFEAWSLQLHDEKPFSMDLVYVLIFLSFAFQAATYRSLEARGRPIWQVFSERWILRQRLREWLPLVAGALWIALGVSLFWALEPSESLSLAPESSRPFIYFWDKGK